MNFKYTNQTFLIIGCTKGIGFELCLQLLNQNAHVIGVARKSLELKQLAVQYPRFIPVEGDITKSETIEACKRAIPVALNGLFLSPFNTYKKRFSETQNHDWDTAYNLLVKWKVNLLSTLLPILTRDSTRPSRVIIGETGHGYSIHEGDVLNNVMKQTNKGLVKSLAKEYGPYNITINSVAFEYLNTDAFASHIKTLERQTRISAKDLEDSILDAIPSRKIGQPRDLANYILWLLGEHSQY